MLEITSGVPNGVRGNEVNVTTSENVTTNTTPTVDDTTGQDVNESTDEQNETLDSYRQMEALVDNSGISSGSESEEEEDMTDNQPAVITRSGRVTEKPFWHANYAMLALTEAEFGYQTHLKEAAKRDLSAEDFAIDHELAGVGAGLGGGFNNTKELRPMKYKEAMATDKKGWTKAVEEEHERMVTNGVWKAVKRDNIPSRAKVLTSTWACKLKSNGVKRARINGRGYEQIDGIHYDSSSIHSPVTNDISVRIVLVLALMAGWIGRISDVKGAFLKGDLEMTKEEMYMKVPEGFEKFYGANMVLLLLKAIYGTKQAAIAFWKELLKCMKDMGYARNGADPCLYYK